MATDELDYTKHKKWQPVAKKSGLYFKMAAFMAALGMITYLLMEWGPKDPVTRFSGPEFLEEGVISSKKLSLKGAPSIYYYIVKLPSDIPGYKSIRDVYFHQNSCQSETLEVGSRLWIMRQKIDDRKEVRTARTMGGCALQNDTVLSEVWRKNRQDAFSIIIISLALSSYFLIAGMFNQIHSKRKH
ncbi:hypothetical protein [Pseudomonas sp. NPDC007930]|uniref:hypothetical protein n=1 Tax=Pseudomonas sp. NPDC007930 TaxID=3364417 RepID=UPI0036EBDE3C